MAVATLAAVVFQVAADGILGAVVRSILVAVIWSTAATLRFSRKGIGGGDLKMMGVTWLTLSAFPLFLFLVLLMSWSLILSLILMAFRLRGIRHLRAGLALAISAITTWVAALVFLALLVAR